MSWNANSKPVKTKSLKSLQSATVEDDPDLVNCHTFYSFKHVDVVNELIDSLPRASKSKWQSERTVEKMIKIIDLYQEQPHLLDPHLESLFTKILTPLIDGKVVKPEFIHISFSCLHPLVKVRGYKRATRYFPHDVTNLEQVLSLLENQDPKSSATWATRYCLLLWLSVVSIVPFDLSRFARGDDSGSGFMQRLIDIGKKYLAASDICQVTASLYLSKLFDRIDAKKEGLSNFIEWCCQNLESQVDPKSNLPSRLVYALLRTLGLLFKHGAREDLLQYSPKVFDVVHTQKFSTSPDILIRKLYCKLLQRLCLCFMKKTVHTWRYERGKRVLATVNRVNSKMGDSISQKKESASEESSTNEVIDRESLPYLERTVAQLISALGDKDGVVRWSAAKGLARICARLPAEMTDQVIKTVLSLFSVRLSSGGWHGASLVVAEFARRGLLRHQMLANVVPLVGKALFYDEIQGSYSLGSHVRDAACYVCWAFARAYRPQDMAPYVKKLAADLVIVMLYDREIQVRRAAAAAFQENVGRQGTFHLGIDILSICDYFAVGNIKTSYLELAPAVAVLGDSQEYLEPLFNHLIDDKLGHWDAEVRDLAAKSLAKLLEIANDREESIGMFQSLLSELNTTIDQNRAHGLLSALSECMAVLEFNAEDEGAATAFHDLFTQITGRPILKGPNGEVLRQALCHLIASVSKSSLPVSTDLIDFWLDLIASYFRDFILPLHDAAAFAVQPVFERASKCNHHKNCHDAVENWIEHARTSSYPQTRSGFLKGISNVPVAFLCNRKNEVIDLIATCSTITPSTLLWTESRVSSLKAISAVFLALELPDESRVLFDKITKCCLICLEDYTSDERGDVAACVREQSAQTLMYLLNCMADSMKTVDEELVRQILSLLAGQSCEKIARTRLNAAHCFMGVILNENAQNLPIPNLDELKKLFSKVRMPPPAAVICSAMPEWSEAVTFKRFSNMLSLPAYRRQVLQGLLISCGDLTESLSQSAFTALSEYIHGLDEVGNREMFATIITLLKDCQKSPQFIARLATSIIKSLDTMVTAGLFDDILEQQSVDNDDELLANMYAALMKLSRSKNFQRVHAIAKLLCSLLALPLGCSLANHPATKLILVLLVHPYPRVRSQTAVSFFEAVSLSPPEDCDVSALSSLLTDTDWSNKDSSFTAHSDICKLLNVTAGKIFK